ncbi:hypothetical protein QBL02_02435 [Leucobacter sp. UT-8R-CII-1-4]|uniref:hypothetical protein n=1 Tax=Leucobacter sp. UT-8R-CII-1-4 TaxID=3040075 RepID=UPI0024A9F2A8|nr:hypothetical protein [Leucobacter sp. UT-8R-CII-1-4]MDI6022401.1 hypothetical protein [Leucobacter sp. UT-8R-CII-1-4]
MDELINPSVVAQLRRSLTLADPSVDLSSLQSVQDALVGELSQARLRDRVDTVREALLNDLPSDFDAANGLVRDAWGDPAFTGWMLWPVTEFVTASALASGLEEDFDAAMESLALLTQRHTGEFAIRDMIQARPERALEHANSWMRHENEHVRRLASEGTRAYLPWAKRVPWLLEQPRATVDILLAGHQDQSEYVRRSVANHLNDLSRLSPSVTIEVAEHWAQHPGEHTAWVLRHGLRTLNKQGDQAALKLLGFSGDELVIEAPQLSSHMIPWQGEILFQASVTNTGAESANVAIDYNIGFQRANGSISQKTFKLTTKTLAPGEAAHVEKKHSFRPITTRRYYPGKHTIAIQANGRVSDTVSFEMTAAN